MSMDSAELCRRYEQLYPGAVTDTLDELGYKTQTLPSNINPLTKEMHVAGLAYPTTGQPDSDANYDANIRRFLTMLSDTPDQSLIAYETNDTESAHLGELSAEALQQQGCRGAVIDGGVRDTRYILKKEFPVFTRYKTPVDAPPRWRLDDWGIPIQIGDVEIRPNDVLIGDLDGMVCVPNDIAEEVLDRAEETVDTEDNVRTAVSNGIDPVEAYEEYGKF